MAAIRKHGNLHRTLICKRHRRHGRPQDGVLLRSGHHDRHRGCGQGGREEIGREDGATMFRALAEQRFHPVFRNAEFTVLVRRPEAGEAAPFWEQ